MASSSSIGNTALGIVVTSSLITSYKRTSTSSWNGKTFHLGLRNGNYGGFKRLRVFATEEKALSQSSITSAIPIEAEAMATKPVNPPLIGPRRGTKVINFYSFLFVFLR